MNFFAFLDRRPVLSIHSTVFIIILVMGLLARFTCAENATNVTSYAVTGVFKKSLSAGGTAIIAHDAIPGYMAAMTMPFNVRNPTQLRELQPGDVITFKLLVTDTDAWIDEIRKTGKQAPRPANAPTQPTNNIPELGAGSLLPDSVLTNQFGKSVHLGNFKGQALAFTFFFSRCPLPAYCPRMSSNFAEVQKSLQESTQTNWQLLSISFDPEFDTPSHLAGYAKYYQNAPQHWNFATSSPEEIRKLGGAFGLMFWSENGTFSHNLRTVVVDASGRIRKVFTDNEWQPEELVSEMKKAMEVKPE